MKITHLSRNAKQKGREMDFPTRSAKERAAHYERKSEKFRRMAEVETADYIRAQLVSVAEQYQLLEAGQPHIR